MSKKPPQLGSSLTDAVVAALGKIDEDKTTKTPEEPAAAEAGCAATKQGVAPPAMVEPSVVVPRANGFRNGPGSFADLIARWSGVAPAAPPARVSEPPPRVEAPPPVEPPAEPPKAVEAAAVMAVGDPVKPAEPAPEPPPPAAAPAKEPTPEEAAAPGGPVRVRYFGRTDVGLVREHNEDNFLVAEIASAHRNPEEPREVQVDDRGCIFAVCDGMGGAAAGEVASQMAVDTILEVMSEPPPPADRDEFARRLVHSIEEAGHRIFSAAKMDRTRRGMGTTTTLAGLVDGTLFVGQVGDSRAYVLRGDELTLVTKDQSLVNQLIEAGQLTEEEAEAFEHSNIILQALGTTEEVTVDLTFLQLRRGDRLMMCSDGLSGLVHADMIKEVLQETKAPNEAAAKLIQMANAGGGHDNISVIVADFSGEGLPAGGDAKASYQQYPLPPADDTVRGKSLPPRDMRMKAPATKPGADVKRDDYAPPADPAQSGGGSKVGLVVVLLLVVLALAAAAGWYFYGGGAAMIAGAGASGASGDDSPPPPPPDVVPDEPPAEPTLADPPVEPPVADPAPEGALGTVEISTDLDEGTLFVNGAARGAIEDGMTLELAPGAYSLEVRVGDTTLAGPVSVSVSAEGTTTATLDAEVVEPPPVEEPAPHRPPPTPIPQPVVRPLPPAPTPPPGGGTGTIRRPPANPGAPPANPF